MLRSRILGTGQALPEKILTNFDLEKIMDTSDEWVRKRTGIAQRHVADKHVGPSSLGAPAAQEALEAAGIDPMEVDLVICSTSTPDYLFPSTACIIQGQIGAKNAWAFDLNAACSGFVYGLATADGLIRAGNVRTALVIGADILTNKLNWNRRDTAVLFGDGAGAVVLRGEEGEAGIITTEMGSDGELGELLVMPTGDSRSYVPTQEPDCMGNDMVMNGQLLFKKAVTAFSGVAIAALKKAGVPAADVDLFVPHQANTRIIFSAARKMDFPEEKVFLNIDKVANTVAATIPIGLDDAVKQGRLKAGDTVLIASFGAGLTWGASVIKW